jgi:hypothetical protein
MYYWEESQEHVQSDRPSSLTPVLRTEPGQQLAAREGGGRGRGEGGEEAGGQGSPGRITYLWANFSHGGGAFYLISSSKPNILPGK